MKLAMINLLHERFKTDVVRILIAMFTFLVAFAAFILSWLGFSYQYMDKISSVLAITTVSSETNFKPTKDAEGRLTGISTVDDHGYFQLTVFNSGNRAISVNNITIYIRSGDFNTLVGVTPTPSCAARIGDFILYGEGSGLRLDARVVEAGRISSIPLKFSWFRNTDPPEEVKQGTVCIRVEAYDYLGRFSQLEFPVGLVLVTHGSKTTNTSLPVGRFVPARGVIKSSDMRRLF